MVTLLFNYTVVENEFFEIIGFIISGLEALAIIISIVRSIIRSINDPDNIDSTIEKTEERLEKLLERRAKRKQEIENYPVDVEVPPADGVEMIESDSNKGTKNE